MTEEKEEEERIKRLCKRATKIARELNKKYFPEKPWLWKFEDEKEGEIPPTGGE